MFHKKTTKSWTNITKQIDPISQFDLQTTLEKRGLFTIVPWVKEWRNNLGVDFDWGWVPQWGWIPQHRGLNVWQLSEITFITGTIYGTHGFQGNKSWTTQGPKECKICFVFYIFISICKCMQKLNVRSTWLDGPSFTTSVATNGQVSWSCRLQSPAFSLSLWAVHLIRVKAAQLNIEGIEEEMMLPKSVKEWWF